LLVITVISGIHLPFASGMHTRVDQQAQQTTMHATSARLAVLLCCSLARGACSLSFNFTQGSNMVLQMVSARAVGGAVLVVVVVVVLDRAACEAGQ
jgi:hypothetical protein